MINCVNLQSLGNLGGGSIRKKWPKKKQNEQMLLENWCTKQPAQNTKSVNSNTTGKS